MDKIREGYIDGYTEASFIASEREKNTQKEMNQLLDYIDQLRNYIDRNYASAITSTAYVKELEDNITYLEAIVAERERKALEEEREPEVDALLWMTERLMGLSAASTMRGWLAEYRATGKLVVRDADGTVKESLTVAAKERQ